MARMGTLCLTAALVIFLIFFGNVAMSAAGMGGFLTDITEMLTLFAAATVFVAGVLARENDLNTNKGGSGNG